ncbi:hypothetical protein BJY52DRAFT_957783 [Lactarius psammicola]|nr:hypothetical protein BJY52DRAFT_957783 [Lactarius psammicola]
MSSILQDTSPHILSLEDGESFNERAHSLDADTAIGSQFRSVSVALGQLRRLPGSPHDETSADQLLETQAYPDAASQFSPHEPALFTGTEGAEPPGHGSASGGEQRSCERCGKISKRIQELTRHVREVHDPPRQCPLCPFRWKRAYKIREHLVKVHHKEFKPVVEWIRILQGQDVIEFVETFEFLRNFELPETKASSLMPVEVASASDARIPGQLSYSIQSF